MSVRYERGNVIGSSNRSGVGGRVSGKCFGLSRNERRSIWSEMRNHEGRSLGRARGGEIELV